MGGFHASQLAFTSVLPKSLCNRPSSPEALLRACRNLLIQVYVSPVSTVISCGKPQVSESQHLSLFLKIFLIHSEGLNLQLATRKHTEGSSSGCATK